jgi:3-methyladenine DNA glycosylase AlkD
MELTKSIWNINDGKKFLTYLESLSNRDKSAWSKRILNSNLDVLALPTKTMSWIANAILKGNYESFLQLKLFENYESIAIYGMIVSKINDFQKMKNYLDIYITVMENWAHCDLLSININNTNKNQFITLSEQYIKSPKVFVRRLGLLIVFYLIRDSKYLSYAFNALSQFEHENEYYVIMMGGWLLSECIIRYKEESLLNLKRHQLNPKIINKGIQKCRESRRLTQQEKDELLTHKIPKTKKIVYH